MALKSNFLKKPGMRIGLVISSLVILIACLILAFWFVQNSLFSRNAHFTLRRIDVRSSGWWNGKDQEISRLLEIKTGSTNLFDIQMKKACDAMAAQPSIEKVSMSRNLPDSLQVNIIERIPRAYLYNSNSPLLVDSNGIVMDARSCVNLKKNLPVITGFKADIGPIPGKEMLQLKQALELIMLMVKKYPEIKMLRINMSVPKEIQMSFMAPPCDIPLNAILPKGKFEEKLLVLKEALKQRQVTGNPATNIDLRFEGQVVLKPPEIEE